MTSVIIFLQFPVLLTTPLNVCSHGCVFGTFKLRLKKTGPQTVRYQPLGAKRRAEVRMNRERERQTDRLTDILTERQTETNR